MVLDELGSDEESHEKQASGCMFLVPMNSSLLSTRDLPVTNMRNIKIYDMMTAMNT